MKPTREQLQFGAGVLALCVGQIGLLFITVEARFALFMLVCVIAFLAAFDRSLDRRSRPHGPAWLLLGLVPLLRAIPLAISEVVQSQEEFAFRNDRFALLISALACFGAVLIVTLPARQLRVMRDHIVTIAAVAITAALVSKVVGFYYDEQYGSTAVASSTEAITWAVGAASITAVTLGVARSRVIDLRTALFWSVGIMSTFVVASTIPSRQISYFLAALTPFSVGIAALLPKPGAIALRMMRSRRTLIPALLCVLAGAVGAVVAIMARGDRAFSAQLWLPLGFSSLALFATGLMPRDIRGGKDSETERVMFPSLAEDQDFDFVFARSDDDFWAESNAREPALEPAVKTVDTALEPSMAGGADVDGELADFVSSIEAATNVSLNETQISRDTATAPTPIAEPAPAAPAPTPVPAPVVPTPTPVPAPAAVTSTAAPTPAPAQSTPVVVSAKVLDSLETGRYIQHCLDTSKVAINITMVLVRNRSRLESVYGVAATEVICAEVARRIQTVTGHQCATFGPGAFAAIEEFDPDAVITREHLVQVSQELADISKPIDTNRGRVSLDIVGAFAHSKRGESASDFVKRANAGLVQAATTLEPSLVVVP